MVNAGHTVNLELTITDQNKTARTDGCEFWEIAFDGLYLDRSKQPLQGKSFLPPGGRTEWIVECYRAGIYEVSCLFQVT